MDINGTLLKVDLVEIAEQAGAHFHQANGEWRSACPLHQGDNSNAFAVFTGEDGKQRFVCFSGGCGTGDVFDFVMEWKGCSFVDAYHWLGGTDNIDPAEITRAAELREQRARQAKEEKEREHAKALADLKTARSWEAYHANLTDKSRDLWRKRGLHDEFIDWWQLGYCPTFTINYEGARWVTDTLTIPIMDTSGDVVNVRHRLLSPPEPKDKYRPERPGLPTTPFIAYAALGYDTSKILVVEGEIKAAVTFQTIWSDNNSVQVIGIPGKNQFAKIADSLVGRDVYICFDPDAEEQAAMAAKKVGGRYFTMPMKIDDAITAGALDANGIRRLMHSARRV